MKHFENKEDLYSLVFCELKKLGVKVQNIKKLKCCIMKQDRTTLGNKNKIFGVSLFEQEWISVCGCPLPKFIAMATAYLKDYTKTEIGLFRKVGSVARQKVLRTKLETGENFENSEPNDVASLLKQWLRELPEPVVPSYLHDVFLRCQKLDSKESRVSALLLACLLLPTEYLYTLRHLLNFLLDISQDSELNKMDPHNLALVIAPNLVCCLKPEKASADAMHLFSLLVETLIVNAKRVGEAPSNIAADLMKRIRGDLDVSIASLDCSPATRRSRHNRGVTDFVSGIRRFVGNSLSPINSLSMDDQLKQKYEPHPRSATKRKADPEIYSMPAKKLTRSVVKEKTRELSCIDCAPSTSNSKMTRQLNFPEKPLTRSSSAAPAISGLKSFGLLKSKNKKKDDVEVNRPSRNDSAVPSTSKDFKMYNVDEEQEEMEFLKVPAKLKNPSLSLKQKMKRAKSASQANCQDRQTESIKKSCSTESACPVKRPPTSCSGSRSRLKRNKSLRNQDDALVSAESIEDVSIPRRSHRTKLEVNDISSMNQFSTLQDITTQNKRLVNSKKTAVEVNSYTIEQSETIVSDELVAASKRKKYKTRTLSSRTKDSFKSMESIDAECKSSTAKEFNEQNVGNFKRSAYKSSLKRGRPNTVKSGLKSEFCPKFSVEGSPMKNVASRKNSNFDYHLANTAFYDDGILPGIFSLDDSFGDDSFNAEYFDDCSPKRVSTKKSESLSFKQLVKDLPKSDKIQLSSARELHRRKSQNKKDKTQSVLNVDLSSKTIDCNDDALKTKECGSPNSGIIFKFSPIAIAKFEDLKGRAVNSSSSVHKSSADQSSHEDAKTFVSANEYLTPNFSMGKDFNMSSKRESIIQIITNNAGKVRDNVNHFNFMSKIDSDKEIHNTPKRLPASSMTALKDIDIDNRLANRRMQLSSLRENKSKIQESGEFHTKLRTRIKHLGSASNIDVDKTTCSSPLKERTNAAETLLSNVLVKNSITASSNLQPKVRVVRRTASKKHQLNSYDASYDRKSNFQSESLVNVSKSQLLSQQKNDVIQKDKNQKAKKILRTHSLSVTSSSKKEKTENLTLSRSAMLSVNDSNHIVDEWECEM